MCNCGCNTCETKIKGPLLTESKVKSLLSEGLQYHIDKKIPLFETVYRIGSDKHLALIKEARKMYSRNIIDLCEDDEALIKTHLGEFALYEGVSVPLDLPMLNEGKAIITFKNDYEVKMNTGEGYDDDFEYFEAGEREQVYILDKNDKRVHVEFGDGTNAFIPSDVISVQEKSLNEANKISDDKLMRLISKMPKGYVGKNTGIGKYTISTPDGKDIVLTQSKDKKNWSYEPSNVALKILNEDEQLDEKKKAKKKEKKDPPLNKPKRGGSKAYYVYVRDPKTKKIKKVSFGSGGLRAKIKNKEARNAFAKRHRCKDKKDRTKAGYWSCNLPRYAPALGLGAKMNTFW